VPCPKRRLGGEPTPNPRLAVTCISGCEWSGELTGDRAFKPKFPGDLPQRM